MTRPAAKITVPEVIDRFLAYYARPGHYAGGSLHVVLDDGNFEDSSVEFCAQYAAEHGDEEGVELATILLQMSQTQRRKIARLV